MHRNKTHTQKVHSLFCVDHLFLGIVSDLEYGWYAKRDSIREKWIFFYQQVLDSFLVRSGILCPLPLLSARTPPSLNLCRPCACGHSLCEFTWASVLLCLEDSFLGIIHHLCLWLWLLQSFSRKSDTFFIFSGFFLGGRRNWIIFAFIIF